MIPLQFSKGLGDKAFRGLKCGIYLLSVDEERLLLIGISAALRVLVVVHCEHADGNLIRLISARRATRSERAQYDARWKQ